MDTKIKLALSPSELSVLHKLVCKKYYNYAARTYEQKVEYALLRDLFSTIDIKCREYERTHFQKCSVPVKYYLVPVIKKILDQDSSYSVLTAEERFHKSALENQLRNYIV